MKQRQQRAAARAGDGAMGIVKRLSALGSRSGHNTARLWDDWISSMALSIANSVDRRPAIWQRREDEYMAIVKRHGPEVMTAFAEMLAELVEALEFEVQEPRDLLGAIYMGLELGNAHRGQFFTPACVCSVMASMVMSHEEMREIVDRRGFFTVQEPAIGGGATVIPIVTEVLRAGLNPSQHLHITGIDIDAGVLRMAYVQLSLLGVPAVLYVGDTLRMEMGDDYYTPVHVLNGWGRRLRARYQPAIEDVADVARELAGLVDVTAAPEPHPACPPAHAEPVQASFDW